MDPIVKTLMDFYRAMRRRQGHRHWWPGHGPLEVCVGAVLTQNTSWRNVERAIANLRAARRLSLRALRRTPVSELAPLIRPAGYFNVKARRLKNFVQAVGGSPGGSLKRFLDRPVGELRRDLLAIDGIGPETADSIILYAAGKPSFVVDAYTRRILLRHGLVSQGEGYEQIKELFESSLPTDAALWNDYHAQLVAVGKTYCRPRRPLCDRCPLAPFPHDPDAA